MAELRIPGSQEMAKQTMLPMLRVRILYAIFYPAKASALPTVVEERSVSTEVLCRLKLSLSLEDHENFPRSLWAEAINGLRSGIASPFCPGGQVGRRAEREPPKFAPGAQTIS